MDHRTEDNRGNHHFDELDETIPKWFEGFPKFREKGPHQNTGRHGH